MANRRIAYVVNHVAFFVSHRLPLAVGARKVGFSVALFTGQAGSPLMEEVAEIELARSGVTHQRVAFRSASINPILELLGLMQLVWKLWRYRPHLVHCASPKGVLYGGIAARICRAQALVLAISGMGYAFTSTGDLSLARKIVKRVYLVLARFAFGHPNLRVIVQNTDDQAALIASGLVQAGQVTRIPGSGVRLTDYAGHSVASKQRIVLLPARILRDKGVEEFVQAASRLKPHQPEWRFVLAGAADYENPSAISVKQIEEWQRSGIVEWLGHVGDMTRLFVDSAIVCLPSYREGMPKALLEAAAAGCAVITTDVPGCREAVLPGITGDLVQVRDSKALAEAIEKLINDPQKRERYGAAGRKLAIDRFSLDTVIERTLEVYAGALIGPIPKAH